MEISIQDHKGVEVKEFQKKFMQAIAFWRSSYWIVFENRMPDQFGLGAVKEYREFISLKLGFGDTESRIFAPTKRCDDVWHWRILEDTELSGMFFNWLSADVTTGRTPITFLHHRNIKDQEALQRMSRNFKVAYQGMRRYLRAHPRETRAALVAPLGPAPAAPVPTAAPVPMLESAESDSGSDSSETLGFGDEEWDHTTCS